MRCLQINKIMHVELYCLLPYSVVQSKVKTKKYLRIVCILLSLLLQNYRAIGDHIQGATLRATVCNFMKLFLKQELAM